MFNMGIPAPKTLIFVGIQPTFHPFPVFFHIDRSHQMFQVVVLWFLSIGCIVFRPIQSKLQQDVCMHKREKRYQQNPYIANPYLRQALESYEILHAQATAGNVTEDLLRAATSQDGAVHRYLYLELTVSGLGNRLNSLLSGFLYALLTRRILLVSAGTYSFDDLFCQPFSGGNWLWPVEVSFDHLVNMAEYKDRFLPIAGTADTHIHTLIYPLNLFSTTDTPFHSTTTCVLTTTTMLLLLLLLLLMHPLYTICCSCCCCYCY